MIKITGIMSYNFNLLNAANIPILQPYGSQYFIQPSQGTYIQGIQQATRETFGILPPVNPYSIRVAQIHRKFHFPTQNPLPSTIGGIASIIQTTNQLLRNPPSLHQHPAHAPRRPETAVVLARAVPERASTQVEPPPAAQRAPQAEPSPISSNTLQPHPELLEAAVILEGIRKRKSRPTNNPEAPQDKEESQSTKKAATPQKKRAWPPVDRGIWGYKPLMREMPERRVLVQNQRTRDGKLIDLFTVKQCTQHDNCDIVNCPVPKKIFAASSRALRKTYRGQPDLPQAED